MPVFSFLKRNQNLASAGPNDEAATVQAARSRARHRLIGAVVLVGAGLITFPLLFETQPRPVAVDIAIELPAKRANAPSVPPLAGSTPVAKPASTLPAPVSASATPAASAVPMFSPAASASARAPRGAVEVITERAVDAVPPDTVPAAAVAVTKPAAASAPVRATAPTAIPPPAPTKVERSAEAARAQALLDGTSPAAAAAAPGSQASQGAARFVVQAGAYGDAMTLRDARQKLEKLGLKTYTQVVQTDAGARTRLRVGPYATREEAEQAAQRIKSSGLPVSVLIL